MNHKKLFVLSILVSIVFIVALLSSQVKASSGDQNNKVARTGFKNEAGAVDDDKELKNKLKQTIKKGQKNEKDDNDDDDDENDTQEKNNVRNVKDKNHNLQKQDNDQDEIDDQNAKEETLKDDDNEQEENNTEKSADKQANHENEEDDNEEDDEQEKETENEKQDIDDDESEDDDDEDEEKNQEETDEDDDNDDTDEEEDNEDQKQEDDEDNEKNNKNDERENGESEQDDENEEESNEGNQQEQEKHNEEQKNQKQQQMAKQYKKDRERFLEYIERQKSQSVKEANADSSKNTDPMKKIANKARDAMTKQLLNYIDKYKSQVVKSIYQRIEDLNILQDLLDDEDHEYIEKKKNTYSFNAVPSVSTKQYDLISILESSSSALKKEKLEHYKKRALQKRQKLIEQYKKQGKPIPQLKDLNMSLDNISIGSQFVKPGQSCKQIYESGDQEPGIKWIHPSQSTSSFYTMRVVCLNAWTLVAIANDKNQQQFDFSTHYNEKALLDMDFNAQLSQLNLAQFETYKDYAVKILNTKTNKSHYWKSNCAVNQIANVSSSENCNCQVSDNGIKFSKAKSNSECAIPTRNVAVYIQDRTENMIE